MLVSEIQPACVGVCRQKRGRPTSQIVVSLHTVSGIAHPTAIDKKDQPPNPSAVSPDCTRPDHLNTFGADAPYAEGQYVDVPTANRAVQCFYIQPPMRFHDTNESPRETVPMGFGHCVPCNTGSPPVSVDRVMKGGRLLPSKTQNPFRKKKCVKRSREDLRLYFHPCAPQPLIDGRPSGNSRTEISVASCEDNGAASPREVGQPCRHEAGISNNTTLETSSDKKDGHKGAGVLDKRGKCQCSNVHKGFCSQRFDLQGGARASSFSVGVNSRDHSKIKGDAQQCIDHVTVAAHVIQRAPRAHRRQNTIAHRAAGGLEEDASGGTHASCQHEERSHYMGLYLCKNMQDANTFVASANYFSHFKKCIHGHRVSAASRRAVVQFIVDVGRGIATPISDFSIHMAINLFDRYMTKVGRSTKPQVKEKAAESIEVIGAACLYICSKLEDSWCLSLGDICRVFDGGSERCREDVLRWELEISREFNFMFYSPTIMDFMYKMVDLSSPILWKEAQTLDGSPVDTASAAKPLLNMTHGNEGSTTCPPEERSARLWNIDTLAFFAGTGRRGYSSPYYFLGSRSRFNDWSWPPASELNEQIAAEALSIGELSLLHHTCIGIPVHLIAAAALLVAVTLRFRMKPSVDNLPQPVRALLGKDRRRLARVVALVFSIFEEQRAFIDKSAINAPCDAQHNVKAATTSLPAVSPTMCVTQCMKPQSKRALPILNAHAT